MDFSYSEEQLAARDIAAQILGDQSTPERLKTIEQQGERIDRQLWADLADAGLLGLAVEEQYGGMGYDFESLCILVEEVGRHVAAAPVIPVLVSAASTLQRFGSDQLKETYLPNLVNGTHLMTAALVEPGNEDTGNPGCEAVEADGAWRLNGTKHCVPFAAQSCRVLVTARAGDELIACLVDPAGDGVKLDVQRVTAGETQYSISFEDAISEELIARDAQADALALWLSEATAAAYAVMATGLCEQMLKMTASYTSERKQFGVPVATFQAVGHRAADAFIDIECLRLLSQQAVSLLNHGTDASEAVLVARVWIGDVTHRISQSAQHLHGGIGVDRDYPLFRYCLWARQIELTAGNSASQMAVLGEHLARQFVAAWSTPTR